MAEIKKEEPRWTICLEVNIYPTETEEDEAVFIDETCIKLNRQKQTSELFWQWMKENDIPLPENGPERLFEERMVEWDIITWLHSFECDTATLKRISALDPKLSDGARVQLGYEDCEYRGESKELITFDSEDELSVLKDSKDLDIITFKCQVYDWVTWAARFEVERVVALEPIIDEFSGEPVKIPFLITTDGIPNQSILLDVWRYSEK